MKLIFRWMSVPLLPANSQTSSDVYAVACLLCKLMGMTQRQTLRLCIGSALSFPSHHMCLPEAPVWSIQYGTAHMHQARVIIWMLDTAVHKNWESHIDASHSRQPLVKGERLVRYEVNAVTPVEGPPTQIRFDKSNLLPCLLAPTRPLWLLNCSKLNPRLPRSS